MENPLHSCGKWEHQSLSLFIFIYIYIGKFFSMAACSIPKGTIVSQLGVKWVVYPLQLRHGNRISPTYIIYLSGWWLTYPSENMSSSVGMMKFPISGKIKAMFQTTNQLYIHSYIYNYIYIIILYYPIYKWAFFNGQICSIAIFDFINPSGNSMIIRHQNGCFLCRISSHRYCWLVTI